MSEQNRIRGTETRNRMTVVRGERGDGVGWKKVRGLTREHRCMTNGHEMGIDCGKGGWARGRGTKEEKSGQL